MKQQISRKDLRVFAYIWALIFFIIGIYPLYISGFSALKNLDSLQEFQSLNVRHWGLYTSLAFLIVGSFLPSALTGFYKIWVKFGELLGGIISKIILLILFYGMFTPISMMLKLLRKDLLHKKLDKKSQSYWINRTEQPGSLKNQF